MKCLQQLLLTALAVGTEIALGSTPAAPICDRHPAVQQEILRLANLKDCNAVTTDHLASVTSLNVQFYYPHLPQRVQASDLRGMPNVTTMVLGQRGKELELEENFFAAFPNLENLHIINGFLDLKVSRGTFNGLSKLKNLQMESEIAVLAPDLLAGLPKLTRIFVSTNRAVPKDLFSNNRKLVEIWIRSPIAKLPLGMLSGLSEVEHLTLYHQLGIAVTAEHLKDLSKLKILYVPAIYSVAMHLNKLDLVRSGLQFGDTCSITVEKAKKILHYKAQDAADLCEVAGGRVTQGQMKFDPYCEAPEGKLMTAQQVEFSCNR